MAFGIKMLKQLKNQLMKITDVDSALKNTVSEDKYRPQMMGKG